MTKRTKVTKIMVFLVALICVISFGYSALATSWEDSVAKNWQLIGPANSQYNCLNYATEPYRTGSDLLKYWEWPWGSSLPTSSQVDSYLNTQYGLSSSSYTVAASVNNIFSYGTTSGITHFSRRYTTSGYIVAKWGQEGIYLSQGYNPYWTSGPYGAVVKKYYK